MKLWAWLSLSFFESAFISGANMRIPRERDTFSAHPRKCTALLRLLFPEDSNRTRPRGLTFQFPFEPTKGNTFFDY